MGYQESLIAAANLEEAQGIMQAYGEVAESTLVDPLAVVKASGTSQDGEVRKGDIFVVVGGERFPVQSWMPDTLPYDIYSDRDGGDVQFQDVTKSASRVSADQGALERTAARIETVLTRSAKRDEQIVQTFEAGGELPGIGKNPTVIKTGDVLAEHTPPLNEQEPASAMAINKKEKDMTQEKNNIPAEFAEGAAAQAPETAKPEWVNLTMKGAFLREAKDKKGNTFFDVSIPNGTKLGGAIDISGYHFTASESRVHDSKFDPNGVTIWLIKDRPLRLVKDVKQEDGTYLPTSREVQPENLRIALNNQYKDYKAAKAAEREALQAEKVADKARATTPSKDQKAAAKSASARAKSATKAPAKQVSH